MEAGPRARERRGISPSAATCSHTLSLTTTHCRGAKSERVKSELLTDVVEPQRRGQAGGGRVQQPSEHVQDALGRQQHPGVTHSAQHNRVTVKSTDLLNSCADVPLRYCVDITSIYIKCA